MKYPLLTSGLIVLLLLSAGCSDESGPVPSIFPKATPSKEARYVSGDIVARTATNADTLWLILNYNERTDKYERTLIMKNSDGTWGYQNDTIQDMFGRIDMEKLYPVKIAHISVSGLQAITPVPVEEEATIISYGTDPIISGITPANGASGSSVIITNLAGKNFVPGATVQLIGAGVAPIPASQVKTIDTKITCVFNLYGASAGHYNVVVTNPDGRSATLTGAFTVNKEAPIITFIDPYSAVVGETVDLTISGSNFKEPAKVYFEKDGAGLEGANVKVKTSARITLTLSIPQGTPAGEWDVIVKNVADNQNSTALLKKFTIKKAL